jgi:two-component SAPR family response regulator
MLAMSRLMGKRVLIVEDDALIGEIIAECVSKVGAEPIGPVMSEREALDLIDYNPELPDAAILDIHSNGMAFGVATRLRQLSVPFIFAISHYQDVPLAFSDVQQCEKPFTFGQLLQSLDDAVLAARH